MRAMRRAGRLATWGCIERELGEGVGSFIVDGPSPGWNDTDTWWTRDSVEAAARAANVEIPDERTDFRLRMANPAFERWCAARYFDGSTGIARLIQCTHWRRDRRRTLRRIEALKAAHPKLEVCVTDSWMIGVPSGANAGP